MTEVNLMQIDELLPQTQCTKCGYKSCMDYAKAMYDGNAKINRCVQGGVSVIANLANLLKTEVITLDPECASDFLYPKEAIIIEEDCIGCMLCIKACPVDAIIGSNQMMHTVISSLCTGCELCISACPVDCMELISIKETKLNDHEFKKSSRIRFNSHQERLKFDEIEKEKRMQLNTDLLKLLGL